MNFSELKRRASEYASHRDLKLVPPQLGRGIDGEVWQTDHESAIKVFHREHNYQIELSCYQRLADLSIEEIDGFKVPELIGWEEGLLAIEIAIVSPPYLLDFGKASLDSPPDYPEEILAEELQRHSELWDDRWPVVQELLWSLQAMGIYYLDPKPGNIRFADEPEEDSASA